MLAPRVKETSTTTGTGTLSLAGAVSGFQTFVAGIGTGKRCYYTLVHGTAWEVGIGTVTDASPDTLSRTTILASSTGSALNLAAGEKTVFCAIPKQAVTGSYGSCGNNSKNNVATPNTQFDLTADAVTLSNAEASKVTIHNPGTITNNVSTAGPAANGRDQAGAFSASSWIHFYWIWNGTTLATLSSAVAPPTGPTLPTGYTHWGYMGAVRFNGSSQLVKTRITGSQATIDAVTAMLSGGTATSETAINTSTFCPPNALLIHCMVELVHINTGSAHNVKLRVITGQDCILVQVGTAPSGGNSYNSAWVSVPNVSQNLYYLASGANVTVNVYSHGYVVPNGGE